MSQKPIDPAKRPEDRPIPKRTWRHARYGDAPDPTPPGPKAQTFNEATDAERTGDARKH